MQCAVTKLAVTAGSHDTHDSISPWKPYSVKILLRELSRLFLQNDAHSPSVVRAADVHRILATSRLVVVRQVLGVQRLLRRHDPSAFHVHVLRYGRLLPGRGPRDLHREILAVPLGARRLLQSDEPGGTPGRNHRSDRYAAAGYLPTQGQS